MSVVTSIPINAEQRMHVDRTLKSFETVKVVSIAGETGSGKTNITGEIALQSNLIMIVVYPNALTNTWNTFVQKHKIPTFALLTVQFLTGTKVGTKHVTNNGLVEYDPVAKSFYVTDRFKIFLQLGVLLVFDEFQLAKNDDTLTSDAMMCMVDAIHTSRTRSRGLLVTATFLDNPSSYKIFFRAIGLIHSRETNLNGREAFSSAYLMDRERALYAYTHRRSDNLVTDMFVGVYKPLHFHRMLLRIDGIRRDVKDGFYNVSPEQKLIAERAMYIMGQSTSESLAVAQDFEFAMIPTAVALAKLYLENVKGGKVLIFFEYKKQTLPELFRGLLGYTLLKLTGDEDDKERIENVRLFNESKQHRIVLANKTVGGTGISLHDTVGDAPRLTLIIPSRNYNLNTQSIGRTYRIGTRSDSIVRLVYPAGVDVSPITRNIAEKNELAKLGRLDEEKQEKVFPGELDAFIEARDAPNGRSGMWNGKLYI